MECTEYTYIKDGHVGLSPESIMRGARDSPPLRATEYGLMCRRFFKPRTHRKTERTGENDEEDRPPLNPLSHGYVSLVLRYLLPTTHIKRLDALRYGHNLVSRRAKIDSRATLLAGPFYLTNSGGGPSLPMEYPAGSNLAQVMMDG